MTESVVDDAMINTFANLLANGYITYSDLIEDGYDEISMELMVKRSVRFKQQQREKQQEGASDYVVSAPRCLRSGNDDDHHDDDDAKTEQHNSIDQKGQHEDDSFDAGFVHKRLASSRGEIRKRSAFAVESGVDALGDVVVDDSALTVERLAEQRREPRHNPTSGCSVVASPDESPERRQENCGDASSTAAHQRARTWCSDNFVHHQAASEGKVFKVQRVEH